MAADLVFDPQIVGPIDAVLLGARSELEFESALTPLISECMAGRGFDYVPILELQLRQSEPTTVAELSEFRQAHGYLVSTGTSEALTQAQRRLSSMSSDDFVGYSDALEGNEGCRFLAINEVRAELGTIEHSDAVFQRATQLLDGDRELVNGHAEWSTCMAMSGYQFATPDDARSAAMGPAELGDLAADAAPEVLPHLPETALEIARADDKCATSTGYYELLRSVQIDVLVQLRAEGLVTDENLAVVLAE